MYSLPTTLASKVTLENLHRHSHSELSSTNTPPFEGYLYLLENQYWQWRFFQFNGTCLVCYSPPKSIKKPQSHGLFSFSSRQSSPRPATYTLPYDPLLVLPTTAISAISVLTKAKLNKVKKSKQFCIQTTSGDYYLLKANKKKDFERWLFVLTHLWKHTTASVPSPTVHPLSLTNTSSSVPIKHTYPTNEAFSLKYHTSVRGQRIQIIKDKIATGPTEQHPKPLLFVDSTTLFSTSPLQTLVLADDAQELKKHIEITATAQPETSRLSLDTLRHSLHRMSIDKESLFPVSSTSTQPYLVPPPVSL
ncbi:hypothetical protein BDF14DRAFT_1743016 [Spinellus fusiger]|nr:hypothetical protein BDF14DRAFT_1743016 [Spinellus fusiger]